MPKLWRIVPHDAGQVQDLQRACGLPAIVAQLLLRRGIRSSDEIERFIDPKLTHLRDPNELPGLSAAVTRIGDAVIQRRRIVVYGDYDADGMTATAILLRCLMRSKSLLSKERLSSSRSIVVLRACAKRTRRGALVLN